MIAHEKPNFFQEKTLLVRAHGADSTNQKSVSFETEGYEWESTPRVLQNLFVSWFTINGAY